MKILVVGSGGREYAIGFKIKKDTRKLYFAPGNGGTSNLGENINIDVEDINGLLNFAKKENIDYTIVGPEVPLCMGIVDLFEKEGLKIFGPKLEGSIFEKSKSHTKKFLEKYNIPTAKYRECSSKEEAYNFIDELLNSSDRVVIKADGLAAGKGVLIAEDEYEAKEFVDEVLSGKYGDKKLVVEEYLNGFEMSLIALVDNNTILPLPTSKDHKKVFEEETGLNTGGMGTYAPNLEGQVYEDIIKKEILDKVIDGFKKENIDYRGVLFIGLMMTDDGVKVLEFNTRFGDPETQVILELIDNDLLDLLMATSDNRLSNVDLKINNKKAMCLVLCAGGYPKNYNKGDLIEIGNTVSNVYHAGTKEEEGHILTNGGRVLNLVYSDDNFDKVIKTIYEDAKKISFKDMHYRKDIGPKVKRIYVKKKEAYDFKSIELKNEIKNSLDINISKVRIYNRYDIEASKDLIDEILYTILGEVQVDDVYDVDRSFKLQSTMSNTVVVSYLPGQFDQREQGVIDTIALVSDENVSVRCATVYEFDGVSNEELNRIEKFIINPVDSHRISLLGIPTTLSKVQIKNLENEVYDNFNSYNDEELKNFLEEKNLAMSFEDLKLIKEYFSSENRQPNETEIAILDTYWSDHCRHTTFNTKLNVSFDEKTDLDRIIRESFEDYLKLREELDIKKDITLMDLGTILSKYLKKHGELNKVEVSSEINACSIKIDVKIVENGTEKIVPYLLMFKNETHNHPTEIEPLGGASTCLGGAIRDPLSGRSFVYQGMRISGAGNPTEKIDKTLDGKLPQIKIARESALGFSSYGNQIGLATGFVDEIYHSGYTAKRLEAGAVIAAAPLENVKRLEPVSGDIVVLLGGRTGRDGIGGATGSSKTHKATSIVTESAQVQKGNAPEERKIQRLFRRKEVAQLIKKCNDFGAGGVSVAIGELSSTGVDIYLNKVPLKYQGLKPSEIAISESQERMAIVISKSDLEKFKKYADEENIESTVVGEITNSNRMKMYYDDEIICDLSYDFIDTNGARRDTNVEVVSENVPSLLKNDSKDVTGLYEKLRDLNITSKKNLNEIFDSSVGRLTVLHPQGGKEQLNPIQTMAGLIPSLNGESKTVSLMSYGFNPYLSEKSQYLGGYYSVVESISKLIATGADYKNIFLTFQEYFEKMKDEKSWSKPLKSLLGALSVSKFFKTPPIGGKDSMSGTFENISVPPTLISFAVSTMELDNLITPEFKSEGKIGLVRTKMNNGLLDLNELRDNFEKINKDIKDKNIISAIAIDHNGTLPLIYKFALGNTGFDINLEDLYSPLYGSFIVEYIEEKDYIENIGKFSDEIIVNGEKLDKEKLRENYLHTLDRVYRPTLDEKFIKLENKIVKRKLKSDISISRPKVVIPAFPGTNSEWDTALAFEKEGAEATIYVFKNQNREDIENSLKEFASLIKNSQILAIPGGFSMGDEPDGSGKFIANVIRSKEVREAIDKLLKNDGLILGICNGFQALIKTGLLPYGKVTEPRENDPTLTFNNTRRHIAKMVDIKILTKNSPWLMELNKDEYKVPISHGEGRFVVDEKTLKTLLENEQVASQYIENPNGSSYSIESLLSPCGKIYGKMGHSERVSDYNFKNIYDIELQNIFKGAVKYFKGDK